MTVGPGASVSRWTCLVGTSLVAGIGVLSYLGSPAHARHDPFHALQQFDAFYLDEPAPARKELGVQPGRPAVVFFFCDRACDLPAVRGAQVVRSSAPAVARQYALLTENGRIGPGYALIDSTGQLRYRTFDPGLHESEIQILVDALQ